MSVAEFERLATSESQNLPAGKDREFENLQSLQTYRTSPRISKNPRETSDEIHQGKKEIENSKDWQLEISGLKACQLENLKDWQLPSHKICQLERIESSKICKVCKRIESKNFQEFGTSN